MLLHPVTKTRIPVVAECVTPDEFSGKSVRDVKEMKVYYGNKERNLGECFDVSDDGEETIRISGSASHVKCIGKKMRFGEIVIEGSAGMHLGAEMRGGRITIEGDVSDWCGAEMRGGEILVKGNAGNELGGAYRGSKHGMDGGFIIVKGSAGNEVGELMKRGVIVIEKDAGAFMGCGMKGGTIFCYGFAGERAGALMERGSIIVYNRIEVLPTFCCNAVYNPTWLRVFLLDLQRREYNTPVKREHLEGLYERYNGDLSERGKGEIFIFKG